MSFEAHRPGASFPGQDIVSAGRSHLNVLGFSQQGDKALISLPVSGADIAVGAALENGLSGLLTRTPAGTCALENGVLGEPFATGGCDCGKVRYALTSAPIFTHCCHCSWCQRETGSAFAVNAMIETARLEVQGAAPDLILTPSASGKGQKIARCPICRVAVWSHYATLDTKLAFVRAGTLDHPSRTPPDVHIFTSTKQPWVILPADAEAYPEFYAPTDRARMFGAERMARREALIEEAKRETC